MSDLKWDPGGALPQRTRERTGGPRRCQEGPGRWSRRL